MTVSSFQQPPVGSCTNRRGSVLLSHTAVCPPALPTANCLLPGPSRGPVPGPSVGRVGQARSGDNSVFCHGWYLKIMGNRREREGRENSTSKLKETCRSEPLPEGGAGWAFASRHLCRPRPSCSAVPPCQAHLDTATPPPKNKRSNFRFDAETHN